MNYRDAALELDRDDTPVEAAWAYELALQDPQAEPELFLNLVAIYRDANDYGFSSAHRLDKRFVDLAFPRALEILSIAEARFPDRSDLETWRLHLLESVTGRDTPTQRYEELARVDHSLFPQLLLYVRSDRQQHVGEASKLFVETATRSTARSRYIQSFRPAK